MPKPPPLRYEEPERKPKRVQGAATVWVKGPQEVSAVTLPRQAYDNHYQDNYQDHYYQDQDNYQQQDIYQESGYYQEEKPGYQDYADQQYNQYENQYSQHDNQYENQYSQHDNQYKYDQTAYPISSDTKTWKDTKIQEEPKKEPRCIYGCVPYQKKPRYICLGVTAVLLIVLGVLGFLFFPRYPQMRVLSLNLVDGVNSFHLTGLESGKPSKNFTVTLDMFMTISVINTNRYYMKVEDIDLKAYIVANTTELNKGPGAAAIVPGTSPRKVFEDKDAKVQIGKGYRDAQYFPSGQNNFTVTYQPDPKILELKDDVILNEIFQSCNIIQPGNRTMTVHYLAVAPVKVLQPIGFVPTFEDDVKINCPFPQSQLTELISRLRASFGTAKPPPK
ncbi:hypothetical protein EDD86DRAFT_247515 [Gorgonomyces haynaldii]|nr:hypothetical protein EDD86DRAFT_247515 [Gorgonomyces haynaldii]